MLTRERIIEQFEDKHGDIYGYDLVKYEGGKTKVDIVCKVHGVFSQSPEKHKEGRGCPTCGKLRSSNKRSLSTDAAIENFKSEHGDLYGYDLVDYVNNHTKVDIVCKVHGVFSQSPEKHKEGRGCPTCGGSEPLISENIIENFKSEHGDLYGYDLVDYVNMHTKVDIVCKVHGVFSQSPNKHKYGQGCPTCKSSKGELKIRKHLEGKHKFSEQYSYPDLKYKRLLKFDFSVVINGVNHLIEYQGKQHYVAVDYWGGGKGFKDRQHKDQLKRDYCINNNIPLLEIRYDDDDWSDKIDKFLN